MTDVPEWRAYTGQTIDAVRGWGWLAALHPDDREGALQSWSQAVAAPGRYETTYRLRRADGVYRTFLVRGAPSFRPDGVLQEWAGFCTDVTDYFHVEQDRLLLLEREQRSRARAYGIQRRLSFLVEVSNALAASLDYERTLATVARLAVPEIADWCVVHIVLVDGAVVQLAAEHVDPSKVEMARDFHRQYPFDPTSPAGVAEVLRTGTPELNIRNQR